MASSSDDPAGGASPVSAHTPSDAERAAETALIWQDGGLDYDFGPQHPLKPIRVELTVSLIRACGFTADARVHTLPPEPFGDDDVERLHEGRYVEAVRRASADPVGGMSARFGLGLGDNPTFAGMHEASLRVCGMSVAAAKAVWEGRVAHAFNPAGGLHHAMPDRAAGFCIYNDPAFGIDWLLRHGAERIAYLDVDTHHGDGVQAMYYDDPRVLTLSLHESGRYLFPGSGFPDEIGRGDARGTSLNVPMGPTTPGGVWLEAFDEVADAALDAFDPQILVTQLGCDTHATDPLAHLMLSTDDYASIAERLRRLAHDHAGGRWVATGGGGYQIASVVPRAWTIYFAELAGLELPTELPWEWMHEAEEAARRYDMPAPPGEFFEGPVRLADDKLASVRREARESVESLKHAAFDLLERR